MPIPFFAKITNNSLKLKKEFVTDAQAHALSQYLINAKSFKFSKFKQFQENQIQFLHLDDCGIKDEGFNEILKALVFQKKVESICYFNNEIGPKSLN